MSPGKGRGPRGGGPLGGCQTTDQSNQASKIVGLPRYERKSAGASADYVLLSEVTGEPGVREEALRGWASCLLAHVARERLPGGIKPAEHEDIRETALRTLATIRGAR